MKAIINIKYGAPDTLVVGDIEIPSPNDNEVLIKIYASSVTAADTMMRKGSPWIGRLFIGLSKPKHPVTGTGFAGEVVEIGHQVKQFQVGEKVFGESVFGAGTNAEYICLAEDSILASLPQHMSYDEGAPICDGAVTSLNFLQNLGNIQQGQKVLIYGASGSLGTAAVQIAKYYGAEVTGVCSGGNVDMVKSLGAAHVVDYKQENFTKNGQLYDMIYDTVGKTSFAVCKSSLTKHGLYLSPVLSMSLLGRVLQTSICGDKKAKFSATGVLPMPELQRLLHEIKGMIEQKKLITVVDRRYPLEQAGDAHRYVETGHKRGNVVLNCG